jgi:hypothetical protein
LEISATGENTDFMSSTIERISPFLKHRYQYKHIFVMDIVVDLGFVHLS